MDAGHYLGLLMLGGFVGTLATVFNALLMRSELTNGLTVPLFAGGALGGALSALSTDPSSIAPHNIMFIALAGYFGGDLFMAIVGARK